jgi:hypothetical protein
MTTPTPPEPPVVPPESATQQQNQDAQATTTDQTSDLRDLAVEIQKPEFPFDPATFRKGVITSISPTASPPTVGVALSGDTTEIVGVRFIDSYGPTVGQTVLIGKQGADIWVIGHIAESASSFTEPALSSGFTNADDFACRRVDDHGVPKMQWKGRVNRSSGTVIVAAGALPVELRPSVERKVLAARGYGGGDIGIHLVFATNGQVSIDGGSRTYAVDNNTNDEETTASSVSDSGTTSYVDPEDWTTYTALTNHLDHAHGVVGGHSHSFSVGAGSHTHHLVHNHTMTVDPPDWISFNNVEYFL